MTPPAAILTSPTLDTDRRISLNQLFYDDTAYLQHTRQPAFPITHRYIDDYAIISCFLDA